MKKLLLLIFLSVITITGFATHNRAGEITYKHISGYTYKITVTTYTKESSHQADKCSLTIHFGDSDTAIFNRINGPKGTLCGGTIPEGEILGNDIKKNIYEGIHTYPGPNTYVITMEDPNRNANICNFGGSASDQLSFFLRTVLNINPFMPPNSSPTLLNPPIDNGCVGECFEHNPGAFDSEGDSLYYSLDTCYANGQHIAVFQYPDNLTPESINHFNGDIIWCVPTTSCQYNIAILITEWHLLGGKRYFVGSVLRDMQIDIGPCQNRAPVIKPVNDTCIAANMPLNFTVYAEDPDLDKLTLTATGGPFLLKPKATFTSVDAIQKVTGKFSWTPNCSEIQLLPYQVTFKVTDNKLNDPLVNFESVFIRVVPPAVTGLTAAPNGTNIELKWDEAFCHDTSGVARLREYDIYRKDSCEVRVHTPCETGVPSYWGYTLIGSTDYRVKKFTDTNNGLGLIHGVNYSYIVVARYIDESESYASTNACAHLVRDVPIITNVSVFQTDAASGKIWIHWAKPLGIVPNLDTVNNPPPYKFVLQQSKGFTGTTFTEISAYTYAAYWQMTDTGFVSTGLNTQDTAYSYRVDFYANGLLKGSTHIASSVFLNTVSSDNTLTLNWHMDVPWTNYRYYISKETPTGSGFYKLIDSTTATTYADKKLVNNVLYCYRVTSVGAYADTSLVKPLYNHSQVKCDKPGDHTPPCQPELTLDTKCDVESNVLTWRNPNTYCSDDALTYNIYYSPNSTDPLKIIATITNVNDTTYPYVDNLYGIKSIAGCYAVTAVDSFNNESPIVRTSCVDNCPYYELPNVFTPNGDNQNDLFTPLPNYRFVKDIEIKIYDRWGLLMFETKDINILWNGTNARNKLPCPSGTYYYICTVNEIRLEGIVPRVIRGFVQLLQEEAKPQR
jgi:gliding motility-associated-like protein